MSSNVAIKVNQLSKFYALYQKPSDRLWASLGIKKDIKTFTALHDVSFEVKTGEVIGIVGRNGSGKSTLLQLICGTLRPSTGSIQVNGRIAALLELGSGFNPEFTGRDNVYMNASVLGLTQQEIDAKFDDIVRFSELERFIDQPVKTYSSGMFMRLAFSVATSVEPDILVVDEALSVGDGVFARKSFDRIMALRDKGATILFCSHNLYQIESLCHRALWIHEGRLIQNGEAAHVVKAYETYLHSSAIPNNIKPTEISLRGTARFTNISVLVDEHESNLSNCPEAVCGKSTLQVTFCWLADPLLPAPSIAITIHAADGRLVASAGTHIDEIVCTQQNNGEGTVTLTFAQLPLLKGEYWLETYLLCEQGTLFYDQRIPVARFRVIQPNFSLEQGLVHLNRIWS